MHTAILKNEDFTVTRNFKNSTQILTELYNDGYVFGYSNYFNSETNAYLHTIWIKYTEKNKSILVAQKFCSRPGKRLYARLINLIKWHQWQTYGLGILRTKTGFLSDINASKLQIGGELIIIIT